MSARGWLLTFPGKGRPKLVSELKRYVPLAWLAFLGPEDLIESEDVGRYMLDRKRAVEQASANLRFLTSLFPQAPRFGGDADLLLAKLRASRCPTIGIEVGELLEPEEQRHAHATIGVAIEGIASRDPGFSWTFPERSFPNPFRPEQTITIGESTLTLAKLLLRLCWLGDDDLTSEDDQWARRVVVGYIHAGRGL